MNGWWVAVVWLAIGGALGLGGPIALGWLRRRRAIGAREKLDALANEAAPPSGAEDPVERALLPGDVPAAERDPQQVLDLYKLMVQTSESLVSRRQGTNTFFLTANGLLVTAIGLFIRREELARADSALIAVLCLTGLIVSWAWRSLLVSFGQLNKGKFAVILRLERLLAVSVFDAEWEALRRGRDPAVYRSFTASETRVPVVFMGIYVVAALLAGFAAVVG